LINEFLKSFIMLLVIMDPFGGIPIFLSLTKSFNLQRMRKSANRAIMVAGILLLIFLFLGGYILDFFSISLESFKIGGGLILFLVGLTYVFDFSFSNREHDYEKDITVPMATPLIAGPGVLTAVIILTNFYGFWIPLLAAIINLLLFWVLMRYSNWLHKVIGDQGSEIMSRIMGLILVAMAVEFIVTGIQSFF
jgi:multiple antibiotic resistance protein